MYPICYKQLKSAYNIIHSLDNFLKIGYDENHVWAIPYNNLYDINLYPLYLPSWR